ncbi:MAG: DUF1501 domain-containing protein [Armatimonadetes bacterium]|nr:DUF1501 domain-containing protein [Armatimonadota bacterium]
MSLFRELAVALVEQGSGQGRPPAVMIDPIRPLAPRRPHFKARAKNVIVLYQVGGPGQMDTFDYKPELQKLHKKPVPKSFKDALKGSRHANVFEGCKDELMASPYKFTQQGKSGLWVSELFPELAKHVDDLCFVHSLQSESNNHAPSSYLFHTGDLNAGKASLGSWITYGLGTENQSLPGYVVLFDAGPLGGAANYQNGFLPPAFQPTKLRDQGQLVLDLTPPKEFAASQQDTFDFLRQMNLKHRQGKKEGVELDARIASYELAYRMQSAALEVGEVEKEPAHLRRAYGFEHKDPRTVAYARKLLLARRLVERGVRFVEVYDMPDKDGWDAHGELEKNHTPRARWIDQPTAALLTDLKQRGLWDETLIVWASEFGRTPMMQGDSGRQHNAAGFTIWLGGGAVKPQRYGATDEIGLMARENPVTFKDLHATILAALGLDNEKLYFERAGRPERLTGVAGTANIVKELLV